MQFYKSFFFCWKIILSCFTTSQQIVTDYCLRFSYHKNRYCILKQILSQDQQNIFYDSKYAWYRLLKSRKILMNRNYIYVEIKWNQTLINTSEITPGSFDTSLISKISYKNHSFIHHLTMRTRRLTKMRADLYFICGENIHFIGDTFATH